MFCRNCGNKLADNAKFCNMCGSPVKVVQPAADLMEPVIPEQPAAQTQEPVQQDNGFLQQEQPVYKPYEPAYQEPIAQPYRQQTVYTGSEGVSRFGRFTLPAVIMFLLSGFLIASPFLKMFGSKVYPFSAFSHFRDLSKLEHKNVFSATFQMIDEGNKDTVLLYVGLWVLWIFEVCALVFLIMAMIRLFSSRKDRAAKFFSDIRISAGLSFFGVWGSICLMAASYLVYGKFSGLFSKVFYIWTYVMGPAALVTFILSIVFAVKAKRSTEISTSYQQATTF